MRACKIIHATLVHTVLVALFMLTIIIHDSFKLVKAHGASDLVGAKPVTKHVEHSHAGHEMQCYFCRSDHDTECLYNVHDSYPDHSEKCTNEKLEEFGHLLKSDSSTHQAHELQHSEVTSPVKKQWACYTIFSLTGRLVVRSCILTTKGGDRHTCHNCHLNTSTEVVPATCCTCHAQYCNDKNSPAESRMGNNAQTNVPTLHKKLTFIIALIPILPITKTLFQC